MTSNRELINWPKGDARFTDIVDPLVVAARQVLDDNNTNPDYVGYNVGEQHINMDILWHLSDEGFGHNEEQGRDKLQVLIQLAVQLGIEQGKRLSQNEINLYKRVANSYRESLELRESVEFQSNDAS